jgi:hypothetical protein
MTARILALVLTQDNGLFQIQQNILSALALGNESIAFIGDV